MKVMKINIVKLVIIILVIISSIYFSIFLFGVLFIPPIEEDPITVSSDHGKLIIQDNTSIFQWNGILEVKNNKYKIEITMMTIEGVNSNSDFPILLDSSNPNNITLVVIMEGIINPGEYDVFIFCSFIEGQDFALSQRTSFIS